MKKERQTVMTKLTFVSIVSSVLAILGSFNPETVSFERAKHEGVVRASGEAFFKKRERTASVSFQIVRNLDLDEYTYMTVDLYKDHKLVRSICLGKGWITRLDLGDFRDFITREIM